MYRLTEKLWLTEDGTKAVKDDDVRARTLLGIAGDEIPEEQARQLGLLKPPKAEPKAKAK